MDLLLENQNREFKQFCLDRGFSLQETDKMFCLHLLSVDALQKVRCAMNQIIIKHNQIGKFIKLTLKKTQNRASTNI